MPPNGLDLEPVDPSGIRPKCLGCNHVRGNMLWLRAKLILCRIETSLPRVEMPD